MAPKQQRFILPVASAALCFLPRSHPVASLMGQRYEERNLINSENEMRGRTGELKRLCPKMFIKRIKTIKASSKVHIDHKNRSKSEKIYVNN